MRKYIIAILFVVSGLAFIFFGLSKRSNKNVYAENTFAGHAKDFDTIFTAFSADIRKGLGDIKAFYRDTLQVKDTLRNREFFLEALSNSEELVTVENAAEVVQ